MKGKADNKRQESAELWAMKKKFNNEKILRSWFVRQ
jgi:hypothetical protein